jgi:glycosyltransferase involved in cell wall biosynthesis
MPVDAQRSEASLPHPLVSVVIIFHNAGPFLREAIESVLTQSLASWELLLVDDGSSDLSPEVARQAAAADPRRIRMLQHPGGGNRGMSASRNLGWMHATGEFVTFLDADDVFRPRALETLARSLESEPRAAMVYGPVEYWYSWTEHRYRGGGDFVQDLGVPTGVLIPPPDLLLAFLRRRAAAPSGLMVRADVLRGVGGFVDAFRGMYEDQAFCAKLCLTSPVLTTATSVYRYRQHAGSSSAAADHSGEYDAGRRSFLDWLEQYLRAQGVRDGPVLAALQRELWWVKHPHLHHVVRLTRRFRKRLIRRVQRLGGVANPVGRMRA